MAYTKGELYSELPEQFWRSGTATGSMTTTQIDAFVARARRRIQRRHSFRWMRQTAEYPLTTEAQVSLPEDYKELDTLFLKDTTTGSFVSPMLEYPRDKFVRLVSSTTVDPDVVEDLQALGVQVSLGSPRIYSRHREEIHLFPVPDSPNTTLVIEYFGYLVDSIAGASFATNYRDSLLDLRDPILYSACLEAAIFFRDSELIAFYRDLAEERIREAIAEDITMADRAWGEMREDTLGET